MLSAAHGMDPSGSRRRHGRRSHIAESRHWLGGSPVMHRDRLTRDPSSIRRRTTLLRRLGADRRLTPGPPLPTSSRGPPSRRALVAFQGCVERLQHVGDEVLGVLAAGRVADEAGGTSSVPQRSRRSAVAWTPPKEVASATSSHRCKNAWRGPRSRARTRPGSRRTASGRTRRGRRDGRPRRPRSRSAPATASAPALDRSSRSAERRQRPVREPRLERAHDGPDCDRQRLSASTSAPSRTVTAPRSTSECPHSVLVPLIIAMSAPSARHCWPSGVARVLSTATSAPAACAAAADRRDVAHVELRVRRRLDPHEPRALDRRADLLGVGGDELHLDAVQAFLRHEPHAGIAVVHRHELVARPADASSARRSRAAMPEANTSDVPPSSAPSACSSADQVGFASRP